MLLTTEMRKQFFVHTTVRGNDFNLRLCGQSYFISYSFTLDQMNDAGYESTYHPDLKEILSLTVLLIQA